MLLFFNFSLNKGVCFVFSKGFVFFFFSKGLNSFPKEFFFFLTVFFQGSIFFNEVRFFFFSKLVCLFFSPGLRFLFYSKGFDLFNLRGLDFSKEFWFYSKCFGDFLQEDCFFLFFLHRGLVSFCNKGVVFCQRVCFSRNFSFLHIFKRCLSQSFLHLFFHIFFKKFFPF